MKITLHKMEKSRLNETSGISTAHPFSVLDHLLEGCQIIGFDWRYIYLNPAAEIHNRRPNKELIGNSYRDMWPGIENTEVFKIIEQVLERRVSNHFENEFIFPDGSTGWFDLSIQPVPEGVLILSIDNTERKRVENALRENEEKYLLNEFLDVTNNKQAEAILLENQLKLNEAYKLAHIGIWEWESDTDTVIWTEELYRIAGLDSSLPAPTYQEQAKLYTPESWKILNTHVERALETGESYQADLELIRPDGDIRYVKALGGAKRDAKGQIKGLFGTLQDITELKQVQEVLREREYLLSASQRASHIGTWSWKVGATKVFWSEETYRIYGLNPDMGPPDFEFFFEIIHPDDRQKMQEWPTEVISGLHPAPVEFRVLRPDGIYRIIRTDGDVIEWVDGVPSRIAGTAYDITESKQAEAAINAKHELFRKTFNISPLSSVLTKLPKRTIVEVNPAFEKLFGYTSTEVIGKSVNELDLWADSSEQMRVAQILLEKGKVHDFEFEFKTKVGKSGSGIFYSDVIDQLDGKYVLTKIMDITERKLAEEALKKSRQLLAETELIGKVGGWEFNIDTMDMTWTDEVYSIHEIELHSHQNVEKGINFYSPKSRPVIEKAVQRAIEFGEPFDVELEIITAKGNLRNVHAIGKSDLEHHRVYGFFQGITDRKKAEEDLRASEEKFRAVAELSPMAIYASSGSDQKAIYINEAFYKIFGFSIEDVPTVGHWWIKAIPDENYRQQVIDQLSYNIEQAAINNTDIEALECVCTCNDGSEKIIAWVGKTIADEFWVFGYDFTDRKLAEETLKKSENEFRLLAESMPQIVWITRTDGWNIYFNQQWVEYTGLTLEESSGHGWNQQFHPEDQQLAWNAWENAIENCGIYSLECRLRRFDGVYRWWLIRGVPIPDSNGIIVKWFGTCTDIHELKQTEIALFESKLKLDSALRSMTDAVFISDTEGRFIDFNDAFATFHKFKNKDECAKTFEEYPQFLEVYLSTGELAPIEQWAVPRALNGEIVKNAEYELRRKDTGETWIGSYSFSPIRDKDGVITGSVVTARDITEQKQADEKIRKKDMEFRKLSANVPDLLFQFTRRPDGTYYVPIASKGIQNIFGCLPEDVIDDFTPIGSVIYPEDADRVIRDIEYSAEHLNYFTCEFRVQIPGREIQWIYSKSTPERLPDGSVTWYGFNTDITHQKQAEEALRESEEKFRMLMESIPLPVTYLNKEGTFVFRNARFLQVFGYTQDEVPTIKEWWIKAYPEKFYREWVIRKWAAAVIHATQNNSDIESVEYRVTCKDGTERVIIISGILINDNLLITFIDITDRKKAENEIRKLNETLEQRVEERTTQLLVANQELEAFSYSVSHDLRAPLRHINGYVDLLSGRYQDNLPEKARHYLTTITDAAKQMGNLIDDLLQFSRTGRQEMRKAKLDMNVLIKEVLEQIKPDVEKREITWSVQKMPVILGDYSLLKQVWINLLDNAVKYTKFKKSTEITIAFSEEKANFVFSVRDNGVGFDMKYAHKLFGVFQRLHPQSEFEGTGIGLANVQRIIHKHNGTVWAEAEPNEGATFFFTIPKNKENEQ